MRVRLIATTTYWGVAVAACLLLPAGVTFARQSGTQVPVPAPPGAAKPAEAPSPPYVELWRQVVESKGEAVLAASASLVFVVTQNIEALARDDGHSVWLAPIASSIAPAVGEDRLFVASGTSLHAIDLEGGAALWASPAELGGAASRVGWHAGVAVAAVGSTVHAVRPNGTTAWRADVGAAVVAPFAEAAGVLYVATAAPGLVAIDLTSGAERWRTPLPTTPMSLTAHHDRVYFAGADGALYAYRQRRDDRPDWRFPLTGAVGQLAVDDRMVYCVLLDNTVRAFDSGSGNQRWSISLASRAASGPVRSDRAVAVPLTTGSLEIVETTDKGPVLRRTPPPPATASETGQAESGAKSPEPRQAAPVVRTKGAAATGDGKVVYLLTIGTDGRQTITAFVAK